MNKHLRLFLLSVLLSFSSVLLAGERSISLSYLDYPPFCGEKLLNGGPMTEIITAAFQNQGYAITLEQLPWSRALKWTKEGDFDGIFTAWYRDARLEDFSYSSPLPDNQLVLFKRKTDNIQYEKLEDLKPYSIGVVRGYANPPNFEAANLNLEVVNTDRQNLLKLSQSHIDLALIDKEVGRYILRSEFPEIADKLDWIEPAIHTEKQYLMFSKARPDYEQKREDFNLGLKNIKASGLYQTILTKHGLH